MINLNHTLIKKRPEWTKRHGKVILLHDNAPSDTSKLVKDTLKSLQWDILTFAPFVTFSRSLFVLIFQSLYPDLNPQNSLLP